jgi:hypothetical protein
VIVTGAPPASAGDDAAVEGVAGADADTDAGAVVLVDAVGDVVLAVFDLDDEQPAITTDAAINALSVTSWPLGRLRAMYMDPP